MPSHLAAVQVTATGEVMVRVTGRDINSLEPRLHQMGFRTLGSAPQLHIIEGYLPIASLPQAEALHTHGLLGVVAIHRPELSLGLVTSQGDWALESDRVRDTALPPFITGNGVQIGVLSDSFATRVAPITTAAQDVANGDLSPVTVVKEGPAASTDEGRGMLQLIHDVATGSTLSFASAFFGEVDFGNQIVALQANGASVIVDDVSYAEEPQYQDGPISQAITNVVNNKGVAYFSSAGNNGTDVYEDIGWTAGNDPTFGVNCFDFDPGAGVDTRQRITIPAGGGIRINLQWDDPFFTVAGVDTNLDIRILRADTGATVVSGLDNNLATQVPSEFFTFTNGTGQTAFDIVIIRAAGPNPGRFKWFNQNRDGNLAIVEFDPGVAGNVTPHAAVPQAEGVGATPYFDQLGIEAFTARGPVTVVFDPAGNPIAAQSRVGVSITSFDGCNTSFFGGSDTEGDGFNNFFGTSASAPHAAAVAAMYRQANPTATPSAVYSALENTADDAVFTPGFDTRTGFGLINAYDAIVGSTKARETNFSDGFETGVLAREWETNTTGAGRIEVSSANTPFAGSFHVTMDSDFATTDSRNELILHANLANVKNAVLSFQQREYSDEDNAMPATFSGSIDADGVAISMDGTNWFTLVSLTGANSTAAYQLHSFNLNKVAADNGLTLSSNTRIKFQQFDNNGITSDGMAFDNVVINRTGTISGVDYDDTNGNGTQDGLEPGRVGQIIYVDSNFNNRHDFGNKVTYAAPMLPVAIADLSTVRVPLAISGLGGTISDIDVSLDLSHTYDSDLDIVLISPAGIRVTLSTDNGGSADNYTGTTFDDEAATLISAGVAPFTGRFRPESSLTALDGEALSGTWYLEITDDVGGDIGKLNSWSLTLSRSFNSSDTPKPIVDAATTTSSIVITPGFLSGNITDIDVTVDITHTFDNDLDIFLTGPGGIKVELSTDNGGSGDNYTNTTFDDEAAVAITAGAVPFTGRFQPEGLLSVFDGMSPNTTWTLTIIDDLIGFAGTLNSWSLNIGRDFSQDVAPIAVVDAGTFNTTLPVQGLTGSIQDLTVSLNMTHAFNADLDVFLTSPTGTKVELFTDVGTSSDNFTGTFLDDAAAVPITAGLGAFTGLFRPEGLLSAFDGEDANGNWTLTVTDDLAGFGGSLVDWSISIASAAKTTSTAVVAISDHKTASSLVAFSGVTGTVNDVNVTLDITHTFDNDLDIFLIGPGGVRVELTTDNGGSNDNFTATTFDDEAAIPVTSGTGPFAGTFRPEGSLSLFDGINPNGFWFLEITDDLGGDVGMLNSWSVTLSTGELFAISGTNGAYTLPNIGAGTHQVAEVLPPGRRRTEPTTNTYSIAIDNAAMTTSTGNHFGSVVDVTAPIVAITPVSPDPRNTAVPSIQFAFSEAVTGFNVSDLVLTRNGGANLLTGAEPLTSGDGITWTLSGLSALTTPEGNYALSLNGFGSGIVDAALNAFTGLVVESWVMDTTAPNVVSIIRVDPSPTNASNVNWTVTFNEPIVTLAPANFSLINSGLGGVPAIVTVSGGGTTWNVNASTGTGNGTLGLDLTNSTGATDAAGNVVGTPAVGQVYTVYHNAPRVQSVVINSGDAQRSRVTTIDVTFDTLVNFPGAPVTAFNLARQLPAGAVALAAAVTNTTQTKVTLTFVGGTVDNISLADGRYTLTVFNGQVSNVAGQLDGDNNGTPGPDYILVGNPATNNLFRLFGDFDGDGNVAANDFIQFRLALGGTNPIFDFDNDGAVAASDFIQFRLRFGGSI